MDIEQRVEQLENRYKILSFCTTLAVALIVALTIGVLAGLKFGITEIFTSVTLLIAFLAWRTSNQITWFTGAMESHSTLNLKIQAKERGIPIFEIDPSDPEQKSGKEINIEKINFNIRMKERYKYKKKLLYKIWQNFKGTAF